MNSNLNWKRQTNVRKMIGKKCVACIVGLAFGFS